MHHTANMIVTDFRWQFSRRENLTPLSYDQMNFFDPATGKIRRASIRTDTLTGAPWVTARETFWTGFGEHCYIADQLIRPNNNLMRGIKDPTPTAAKRIPQWVAEKYYPNFNRGNFSAFSSTFTEVGECNHICHPIPKPTFMRETEAGRRQYEAFIYDDGFDLAPTIDYHERIFYRLWLDLNKSGYCSPYVTTY